MAPVAPSIGSMSSRPPGRPPGAKNKPKDSSVPELGTKTSPIAVPQKPVASQAKYMLPEITPALVVRLFDNIPEYKRFKINNLDLLMKGMIHLATQPVNGVGPGGLPVQATPFNNFLAQLVMLAVEKGSKGVGMNG